MKAFLKNMIENITYIIGGISVCMEENDPELWENPGKKERIRRRQRRLRERMMNDGNGKNTDE